jgi:CRP-like cAMP-binding protein
MEETPQSLDTLIELMAFLKKVPLFSELGISELGLIARIAGEEEFPDDTVLIEEGMRNEKLFILARGFIELSARLSGDQEGSLGVLSAPDCLGEDGIFNDSPSPVSAQVIMGKARIITMEGEDLKRLIRLYPEIGIGLLASTSSRLQKLQRMMIKLEQ